MRASFKYYIIKYFEICIAPFPPMRYDYTRILFLLCAGDSEVQRTMLELLNQLDGFEATKNIKVEL